MNAILYGSASPIDVLVGIDNIVFELKAGQPFTGVKEVPAGVHVFHWGNDTLRYGYWFDSRESHRIVYHDEKFELIIDNSSEYERDIASNLQFMITYPTEDLWQKLSNYISFEEIQMITGDSRGYADSSMTSVEEAHLLQRTLSPERMDIPSIDPVFHFCSIRFKSLEAIRQNYRREDFMDKSYYLNHVILPRHYGNSFDRLLGELQFAFLNVMVFGNYSSSLQWHSIVELIAFSSQVNTDVIRRFDKILSLQLVNLQQEYIDFLLNPSVWSKVLNVSHQSHNLPCTRRILLNRAADLFEDESQERGRDSDEYKPTVVGGVYYGSF